MKSQLPVDKMKAQTYELKHMQFKIPENTYLLENRITVLPEYLYSG